MRLKKLIGDSAIYGITGYLTIVSGILLTPLYTRMFSKSEYGVMDILNTWNTFATGIIPLGLITCILRYYPDFSKDPNNKKKSLGTILTTILFVGLLYAFIMFFLKDYFVGYLDGGNITEIYYHSIFLVIAGLLFAYITTVLQTKFKKYSYMLITILSFVILSVLGFVFVYYNGMRLEGFYRASSIAMIITLIIGFFLISGDIFFYFDKKILKTFLKYSLPILSVFFMFQATNILDRILLMEYGNLEDVGIFNIGTKISGIVRMIFTAFATAWFPLAMSIKDDSDAKETYKKVHNVFFLGSFIVLCGLFIFRKELILFFAPDYYESYNIIGILGLFNAVSISIYVYSLGLHIKNKTKYLTISAIGSILVNAFFSILLINMIGIDGIAWGTLLGGIVWVLIQLYYSQKFYHIKFNFLLTSLLSVGVLVFMFFTSSLDSLLGENLFFAVGVKSVFMMVLIIVVYCFVRRYKLLDIKP